MEFLGKQLQERVERENSIEGREHAGPLQTMKINTIKFIYLFINIFIFIFIYTLNIYICFCADVYSLLT